MSNLRKSPSPWASARSYRTCKADCRLPLVVSLWYDFDNRSAGKKRRRENLNFVGRRRERENERERENSRAKRVETTTTTVQYAVALTSDFSGKSERARRRGAESSRGRSRRARISRRIGAREMNWLCRHVGNICVDLTPRRRRVHGAYEWSGDKRGRTSERASARACVCEGKRGCCCCVLSVATTPKKYE